MYNQENFSSPSTLIRNKKLLLEKVKQLNLFSDLLAKAVFQNKQACEHVLRILTGISTLTVKENRTQYVMNKLTAHDIIMDVLAEDENNKLYEIEIQKADGKIAHAKRMLYYSSTIISEFLRKGDKNYTEVPELYIFYISETDIWHLGQTCYKVQKYLGNTEVPYDDGLHMFYINAEVNDKSAIADLMQYFKTSAVGDYSQGILSQYVNELKIETEGKTIMCELSERLFNEGLNEGLLKGRSEGLNEGKKAGLASEKFATAKRLLAMNFSLQDIAKATELPIAEIEAIKANK